MADPLVLMQVVSVIDERTTVICLHANGMISEPDNVMGEAKVEYNPLTGLTAAEEAESKGLLEKFFEDPTDPSLKARVLELGAIGKARREGVVDTLPARLQKTTEAAVPMSRSEWADHVEKRAPWAMEGFNEYRAEGFRWANGWLRGGPESDDARRIVDAMDTLFDRAAIPVDRHVTLLRGMLNESPAGWDVGSHIVERGFLSTTTSPQIAEQFSSHIAVQGWNLRISVPKGTKVVWGDPSDSELILNRGHGFRVAGKDEVSKTVWLELES